MLISDLFGKAATNILLPVAALCYNSYPLVQSPDMQIFVLRPCGCAFDRISEAIRPALQ